MLCHSEHIEFEMRLAPNPANQELFISFSRPITSDIQIQITDVSGTLIYSKKVFRGQQNLKIRTEDFQSGIYFMNAFGSSSLPQQRFVIIH